MNIIDTRFPGQCRNPPCSMFCVTPYQHGLPPQYINSEYSYPMLLLEKILHSMLLVIKYFHMFTPHTRAMGRFMHVVSCNQKHRYGYNSQNDLQHIKTLYQVTKPTTGKQTGVTQSIDSRRNPRLVVAHIHACYLPNDRCA